MTRRVAGRRGHSEDGGAEQQVPCPQEKRHDAASLVRPGRGVERLSPQKIDNDDPALGLLFGGGGGLGGRALHRDLELRLLVPSALLLFPSSDLLDDERRQHG